MEAYQERVIEEKRELDDKINKLESFITDDRFSEIPVNEQVRLRVQYSQMEAYSNTLCSRIEAFK